MAKTPPNVTADGKPFFRILSIDGGGIRGILPGQILVTLESILQKLTKRKGARIADFFDLIAGTSTGGILTCLYLTPGPRGTRPKYTAQQAVDLYLKFGGKVFDVSAWQRIRSGGGWFDAAYSADGLKKLLKKYLADVRLCKLLKPCLITAYDTGRRKAHFFKQHRAKTDRQRDFTARAAARATSAAPTYFEAANIKAVGGKEFSLIDGGVFANNPTLCAYAEARTMNHKPTANQMVILSLGTGEKLKKFPFAEIRHWGKLEWAVPVLDIMMSGVSETVDYQLKQVYRAVKKPGQYLRIMPGLGSASQDMDDASPRNLRALKAAGQQAARKNRAKLEKFALKLIQE